MAQVLKLIDLDRHLSKAGPGTGRFGSVANYEDRSAQLGPYLGKRLVTAHITDHSA